MIVLVDTPIWSLALRRNPVDLSSTEKTHTRALAELVREGRAQIVGVIRQELLSGIREQERFVRLRESLRAFEEPDLEIADYEQAAEMHNHCRARGIAGSAIDLLICSIAYRRKWEIFTSDRDFQHYGRVLALKLFSA